ncbi:hypothetical protein L3C95_19315 [Chitinophaga filiformis]|uniref:alpha/beta hydrolase-fold protein n=1 Tax=Chitinophaga filiformis TaxID=104663 RepID=UPI001EEAC506|nr:alpha/beta hydrolase-fold protein [Chitinophaga filiformis]MCF6405060.1 hypothetical protein [Chitinophaga filiformis]
MRHYMLSCSANVYLKLLLCSVIFLSTSFCVNAQENSPFTTGFEESVHSKILAQERKIWIHIPNSNGGNKIKDKGNYPVIYLLDGRDNFNTVVSIIEHMTVSGLCPPTIVVGILQSNRLNELTTGTDKEFPGSVGNGEKFISFIEKELIPYIDATYPTTSYKIFIGHSLGGLAVTNTFLHKPYLFNSYVSLDGSLWWDNQRVVKEAKTILPTQNYKGKTLYIALANRLEKGEDTLSVQKDTSSRSELIRSNLTFIKYLSDNSRNQLRFRYRYYEDDNHPSVRLIGEYDALRFVFNFYKLKIYDSELNNPGFKLDSVLLAHYKNVSEQMGYTVKPDENQVNNLGYQMLRNQQFVKAETLFKLNTTNYPNSANCYDSLGDLYLETGNKTKAIENFKKALTLKAIPETKEKLEQLQNEKSR